MFDDLAKSISSTLSGVFGGEVSYTRTGDPVRNINAVLRKDVEMLDDTGQMVARVHTLRVAYDDIDIVPQRGDTAAVGGVTYTVGRRLADDGYAYVLEVTA
jgi:hypothetical protein